MTISERLSYVLSERKITQKELSSYIGVYPSTLNNWIKFNRSIPSEYSVHICEFLGIDLKWFLTGLGENGDISSCIIYESNIDITSPSLNIDEKLLLSNYRDSPDDKKIKLQKEAAKMALQGKYSESSNLKNSKSDVEFTDGVG